MIATETGLYVYGVVASDAELETVELLREGPVAAIVSRVDLAEYGAEPLRRNLEDREWLEDAVREHDRVLAGATGATALVPLRFGAVYRSDDGVRAMLRERAGALSRTLERLRGRVELGVKAFLLQAQDVEEPTPASGREYLLRKQRARDAASTVQAEALESVRSLHERLASIADDARVNRPQPPELSGRRQPMLLNAAYLVRTEEQPEFTAAAEDGTTEQLEVVVTGPWPAYNFVEPEGAQ